MSDVHIVSFNNAQIAHYSSTTPVLNDVNFTINQGEFVYLIGKTGSGKSSLLKTLYGAIPLQKGAGRVVGYDLNKLNRNQIPLLRRKVGIVFQDFSLLTDRSVFENLMFVLRATNWKSETAMHSHSMEILNAVGLTDKADRMPYQLSGGEQQRIVIARALLNSPELLIADEPTGNLDPETSDDILVLIRELSAKYNTAVLLATHDYRMLEHFPARIMRCSNGGIYDDKHHII